MTQRIVKILPSLFLWQFIIIIAGFGTQILLARFLGPHDKGIMDLFLLIPMVLTSIVELGLLSANTYYAGKKTISFQILHSNSLIWSVSWGVFIILAGFIIISVMGSPFASLSKGYFLISLATVLPSLYFLLWSGLMYGSDNVKSVYFISGIVSLISLVSYGAVFFYSASLEAFLQLSAALLFIKAAISLFSTRKKNPLRLDPGKEALKQSLIYGLALYIGLAINSLHSRADQFLINSFLGPTQLGYYALSVRIAELVWLIDYVIVTASLYRVTSSDRSEAILVSQRSVKLVAFFVIVSSMGIFILSPLLLPLIFGKPFEPAITPLWFLLPGIVFWSLGRSLAPFISYHCGKPWYNTVSAAIAFAVNLALNFILIPKFGIGGAAGASSISYGVNFIIITWMFKRFSGAGVKQTFLPTGEDFRLVKNFLKEKYILFSG